MRNISNRKRGVPIREQFNALLRTGKLRERFHTNCRRSIVHHSPNQTPFSFRFIVYDCANRPSNYIKIDRPHAISGPRTLHDIQQQRAFHIRFECQFKQRPGHSGYVNLIKVPRVQVAQVRSAILSTNPDPRSDFIMDTCFESFIVLKSFRMPIRRISHHDVINKYIYIYVCVYVCFVTVSPGEQ